MVVTAIAGEADSERWDDGIFLLWVGVCAGEKLALGVDFKLDPVIEILGIFLKNRVDRSKSVQNRAVEPSFFIKFFGRQSRLIRNVKSSSNCGYRSHRLWYYA